jgi:1,4-dihydroxy-2-naphthoate octaprenyltransferase
LPAAVVPVCVGTACGFANTDGVIWWRAACALVVALAIQVATNYANDYSDGIRGTDTVRVGPVRLVAGGLAAPATVKRAALVAFCVAGVAGLALAIAVSPWLLVVGAASIAAGWFYTGGPRPYGYAGLGEVFVFAFFGLVATAGSAYVQSGHLHQLEVFAAVPVGLLAVSLLVVNNLRDIPGDTASGKRTLAVRIGDAQTRWFYLGCLGFAFASLLYVGADQPGALLGVLALPFAIAPIRSVRGGALGRDLIPVLGATGRLQLVFGLLLTAGVVISSAH